MTSKSIEIAFRGHADVRATDPQAIELVAGDSWVSRSRAIGYAPQYDPEALLALRGRVSLTLRLGDLREEFEATVSPEYMRNAPLVFRREPTAARVFAIQSSKGAADFRPDIRRGLQSPGASGVLTITPMASPELPLGVLVLVGMAIGSQGDLSPRALDALSSVDVIFAEDTRVAHDALGWRGVRTRLESCYAQNEKVRAAELQGRLLAGERVAYVSDAGMPAISDPGAQLVQAAIAVGAKVTTVPGPSAVTAAMAISGLGGTGFVFHGFPARKGRSRGDQVVGALDSRLPSVFFESPRRILDLLKLLAEASPTRQVAVCRDISKQTEAVYRGEAAAVLEELSARGEVRGEYTLVVAGAAAEASTQDDPRDDADRLKQFVQRLLEENCPTAPIVSALRSTGLRRSDAYAFVQMLREGRQPS